MADEVDVVLLDEVGNGIKPIVQFGNLIFVYIITAASEIDAFPDFILMRLGIGCNAEQQNRCDQ